MRPVLSASILLLGLAGCAQSDPYTRDGMWQPEGINDRNLAAMVANPADLLTGHGEPRPEPQVATAAVTQFLAGHAKQLPSLSSEAAPGSGSSSGSGSAAPAATPGAN